MTTKHTPGPWKWTDEMTAIYSGEPDARGHYPISEQVIPFFGFSGGCRTEANARLIAAAPELLEALTALMEFWDNGSPVHPGAEVVSEARAAIAKATAE